MTICRFLFLGALAALAPACSDSATSPVDQAADAATGDLSQGSSAACSAGPITITHDSSTPQQPIVHLLSTAKYPLAVCNDGTPGAYIFRPGVGGGSKRWIIYLEGGGSCVDSATCKQRYDTTPFYMSSSSMTDGQVYATILEGIKSTERTINPDFYDANYLQLVYCSSDAWSGDKAGDSRLSTSELGRWNFRGKHIVEAVLSELAAQGLAAAEEVFLMGSSAGGLGVVNNADDVRAALPSSVRYVAMPDAGFIIDYPALGKNGVESPDMPTYRQVELAAAVAAWGGRGDASCEAAATTAVEHAYCRSVYDVLHNGYVKTPLFIRQSEYDKVQLKQLLEQGSGTPAQLQAYRMRFAQSLAQRLMTLTGISIFATNDNEHGVINDNALWTTSTVDGLLLPATVGSWYRTPCAPPLVHIATP